MTRYIKRSGRYLRNAAGAYVVNNETCCCGGQTIVCLPRIPATLRANIVGTGGSVCLDGDYTLSWNATLRRWEATVTTCAETLTLTVNEIDCYSTPCTPDTGLQGFCSTICGGRPNGACLVWSIRCASLGFVNSPLWLIDETHAPVGGHVQHATNSCVSDDWTNPDVVVTITEP